MYMSDNAAFLARKSANQHMKVSLSRKRAEPRARGGVCWLTGALPGRCPIRAEGTQCTGLVGCRCESGFLRHRSARLALSPQTRCAPAGPRSTTIEGTAASDSVHVV